MLKALIEKCRKSESSLLIVVIKYLRYKIAGKNILANHKVIIKGLRNIHTNGLLQIGMGYVGFMHKHDITYLNINGNLTFQDNYSVGKGCRFDIGNGATAKFGSGYVNSKTKFIIMHGITVGDDSAISWGCEFLDEDFHSITYNDKKERAPSIEIGSHVWVGSNVTVLKGSRIPDGCVIASGSVISSRFDTPNCLIGGNPARVIRENVEWE
jgi:acetyltransferase-like isoleucine patch superfamily enzyme